MQDGGHHADSVQPCAVARFGHLTACAAVEVFPNELWNTLLRAGAQVGQGGVFCVQIHIRIWRITSALVQPMISSLRPPAHRRTRGNRRFGPVHAPQLFRMVLPLRSVQFFSKNENIGEISGVPRQHRPKSGDLTNGRLIFAINRVTGNLNIRAEHYANVPLIWAHFALPCPI